MIARAFSRVQVDVYLKPHSVSEQVQLQRDFTAINQRDLFPVEASILIIALLLSFLPCIRFPLFSLQ